MFLLLKVFFENLRKFDHENRDPRSANFFLLGSYWQMISLVTVYYIFVKHLGPKLMHNREPFNLKYTMLVYNAVQVLANIFLFSEGIYQLVAERPYDRLGCMLPLMDSNRKGMIELGLGYRYLLLKFADYLDTVFFVLRKHNKQISFLHVYHHIMISVGTFLYMRYIPGGHAAAFGLINGLVHVIMYFYYFVSALHPATKNSLWWKKYITQVQIAQFLILIVHFARPLLNADCQYSKVGAMFALIQNVVMAVLFLDFYVKTYLKKQKINLSADASNIRVAHKLQ